MEKVTIPLQLTPDDAADLGGVAAHAKLSPAALAADIVGDWLGPRVRFVEAARMEARRRLAVLVRWWIARRGGQELGFADDDVTAHFLRRLVVTDNLRLCRATLYNWESRWKRNKLAGLMDRRKVQRPDRTAKAARRVRKARLKGPRTAPTDKR